MDKRRQFGRDGETAAASFLARRGIPIIAYNYRCRFGEIDLIATEGNRLLVIEVKRRSHNGYGLPCEAVDYRKQDKICRTFDHYRMRHYLDEYTPVRFDVIEVYPDGHLRWIKGAFSYIPQKY